MELKRDQLVKAIEEALKDKGKRKFKQSVELVFNFRSIDFSKPENRVNIEVKLPKDKGKPNKLVVVVDEATSYELKKKDEFKDYVKALTLNDVEAMDLKKVKALAKDYFFYADPKFIGQVAKKWARTLGPRGKAPRPLIGKAEDAIKRAMHVVRIQTRGKYLPTLQTVIGSEDMKPEDLAENGHAVIEAITKKIPMGNIKSMYVKLTMSKPVKV